MSSTYSGNASATQAPSDPPGSGTAPKATLPADGDALVAASVAQMAKVAMDYAAWAASPFPASGAALNLPVMPFQDARLRRRFMVNHYGVPGGAWERWVETWAAHAAANFTQSGTYDNNQGRWHIMLDGAGADLTSRFPGVVANENFSPNCRALNLTLRSAAASQCEVRLNDAAPTLRFDTQGYASLSWEGYVRTVINTKWAWGFTIPGVFVNDIQYGAWFERPEGGTNWRCKTANASVVTDVDSTIAGTAAVTHHFRIDLVGSGIADDSTTRALFYIDGVQRANITTNLPTTVMLMPFFAGKSSTGTANLTMVLGAVEHVQITRDGPTVY